MRQLLLLNKEKNIFFIEVVAGALWRSRVNGGKSLLSNNLRHIAAVSKLNQIAQARGQTMAQMAIAWVLRHPAMASALIGASRVSHIESAVAALDKLEFSDEELKAIDDILGEVSNK